jgi:hypothetical protein
MMRTMEEFYKFEQLSPAEKIEARISWLERKMVEVLWFLINITALLAGAMAAWLVGDAMEMQSVWLYAPVGLVVWGVAGWRLQRTAFRGAPPHVDFIDP